MGFSSSVPGPQILQENINCEEDIGNISCSHLNALSWLTFLIQVSAQGSDMTDGCGLSSRSIHSFLLYKRNLASLPTAFQFRLAGYKVSRLFDC